MSNHALGRADWNFAEQFQDRFPFGGVIERRRSAVSIDIIHLVGCTSRALQCLSHRPSRTTPGRIRLSQMMIVRRDSVTNNFRQNLGATLASAVEILECQNSCALAEDHS